jgi:hypothetical protein
MFGKTARLALAISLTAQAVAAQDKEKPPPKTDPAKAPPPIILTAPPAATPAMMLLPPLKVDSINIRFQNAGAGGGTRPSADGRYVAINHPFAVIEFSNPGTATTILRGYWSAMLYRGTPPATPTVSVRPAGANPTVPQMFADMPRWAFNQYTARKALFGNLRPGEPTSDSRRFANPLDSLTTHEYNGATWTPRETIIVEVGVPYTLRADIAHELDGMTRFYRADLAFRFDVNGRPIGARISYPTPPPPTSSRPSVEIR